MKVATWLVVCCALAACDLSPDGGDPATATVVRDIGVNPASGTPPMGEGIAPLDGVGGDGSPAVPGKGLAEGGPGAIRWYGGQWIIPYQGTPGAVIQNVSCDVVPNASSTDLIELIGSAGVIGSVTVPAASGITIRAWITTPQHTIADGEPLVVRHSPRDSVSGAWTSGVQQLTIIGCAVNTTSVRTIPLAAAAFVAEDPAHPLTYAFGPISGPSFAARASVPVPIGHQIIAVRAIVGDNSTDPNAKMNLQLISMSMNGTNVIASSPVSLGNGTVQTLSIAPATIAQPHTAYFLHVYALGQPSATDALWFAEVDLN